MRIGIRRDGHGFVVSTMENEKGGPAGPPLLVAGVPPQLRSARAARLPLVSLELPEPIVLLLGELDDELELLPDVEGLAPIVPLLLLGVLDELELEDGVLDEPEEPVVEDDGELEDDEDGVELEEPLAPMEVPLLLGVLADELEESLELLLALGLLLDELLGVLLDEELLGVVLELEPEAPIVPVDGWVEEVPDGEAPPAAGPAPAALLPPVPALEVPPEVPPPDAEL
jgi:hypothetical protein